MKTLLFCITLLGAYCCQAQVGTIITVCGNGTAGYSGDGGSATSAEINMPHAVSVDNNGNYYIVDQSNNCIRKVNLSGIITTIAGTPGVSGYTGDGGQATAATINTPYKAVMDKFGNLVISDNGNAVLRKVSTTGIITTICGSAGIRGYSGDGGPASVAVLNEPAGLAFDTLNNLYFADWQEQRIRKIDAITGIITTIAGTGIVGYTGDGGQATNATFSYPNYLYVDKFQNLYISDNGNGCVRKVNTSGIITTIAGTGVNGYNGDGIPAISAQLNYIGGITMDNIGNLFIADYNNNRIRVVNTSGIISTIGGTGIAGFSGDGGSPTVAELDKPVDVAFCNTGSLLISDYYNQRIRKISFTPNFVADSFSVYLTNLCGGLLFNIVTNTYSSGQHIVTYFGNGTSFDTLVSVSGTNGIAIFTEAFATSGNYSIKNILFDGTLAVDSITYIYQYNLCNTFQLNFYYDANNDCVFDSGDNSISVPLLCEVDSNATAIDTISSISGLYYNAYGNPGDIYSFKIINNPGELVPTCPASGIITDTIQAIYSTTGAQYIGFQCAGISAGFDLAVTDDIVATGIHDEYGYIYVDNLYSCDSVGATVTAHYSQKYLYQPAIRLANPLPASYTDSTITWNLSELSVDFGSPVRIFYQVWDNPATGLVPIGDLAQTYVVVTPFAGDIDTLNNTCVIIDTVKSGCDPNEMFVKPQGIIPPTIVTPLQYTINFENTGNDTAFNIYVMDTLSDNVDISTFRMVLATAPMNITKYRNGGHNIVKFEFPDINLLDSAASLALCNGAVIFNISSVAGLPIGATVFNHAGIFFDYNPVVMTDTVEDIVGVPLGAPSSSLLSTNLVSVYPNPATNSVNITDTEPITSIEICNIYGQVVLNNKYNATSISIDISTLLNGVYIVKVNGIYVRKVLKE